MQSIRNKRKMQVIVITRHQIGSFTICKSVYAEASRLSMKRKEPIDKQTVLLTVVTRYELPILRQAMVPIPSFVSIADNVQILGHFYEGVIRQAGVVKKA